MVGTIFLINKTTAYKGPYGTDVKQEVLCFVEDEEDARVVVEANNLLADSGTRFSALKVRRLGSPKAIEDPKPID